MKSGASAEPVDFEKQGDTALVIRWADGHQSPYTYRLLRERCPCASCQGEFNLPPPAPPTNVSSDIQPLGIQPIGHYAIQFRWNDGHQTGIYSFDYLRSICPCPECRPKGSPAIQES